MSLLSWVVALGVAGQPQPDPCVPTGPYAPSDDLYCLHLVAAPAIVAPAAGYVALDIAPGPFTVAVTRDGIHRYRPRITLSGLPDPQAVDDAARVYIAWVATPRFGEWTRLGVVHNGTTSLPEIALNQFIVLVTAESDSLVAERTGPLVLRGESPSTRMQPPDFQEFAVGVLGMSADALRAHETHGAQDTTGRIPASAADHAEHRVPAAPAAAASASAATKWTTVPMPAGFAMLPAEMALRPGVGAQLPQARADTPWATRSGLVRLHDGDTLQLTASAVRKRIHGREYTMLGFNGQIPGPLLHVDRGTSVTVRFENQLDQPSSVHWHGLRQDWRMDGAPPLSQDPVSPGERFVYTLQFPDAGLYWYHPHVREEMQQDLGLSGNLMVQGMDSLPEVTREEVLLLDDILIGDDGLVPFGLEHPTHALMGRFGNVFLVNGEPRHTGAMRMGETVRVWFTNAANTRTFNLVLHNATVALVAADMGAFPEPIAIGSVVLAPAERYAVDVTPTGEGPVVLTNQVQALDHLYGRFVAQRDTLAVWTLAQRPTAALSAPATSHLGAVATQDSRQHSTIERTHPADAADSTPDFIFEFGLRTRDLPFTTSRMMLLDSAYFHPVEWSGTMPMMNWATTAAQANWFIRDARSGHENLDASFHVKLGDTRTMRLVNPRNSLHAMQHPIHMHGQRFRIVAVNGVSVHPAHQAWKDTVLLPAGGTVDLVVEFANSGHWMLHCHIAEHVESGMMTHFTVEE